MRADAGRLSLWSLALLLAACSGAESPAESPARSLCPSDAPPAALELCVSFDGLQQGGGAADVGGLNLRLEGSAELVAGRSGQAIQFGEDGGRLVVEGFSFDAQQLTVEGWVKATADQQRWASVVDYWTGDEGFWLGGSSTPGGWEFWSNLDRAGYGRGLVKDQWQHLAGVFDGGASPGGAKGDGGDLPTLRLYINGVLLAQNEGVYPFSKPALAELYIGSRGDKSDFFRGLVDEVQVWSEARTPEQICGDAGATWSDGRCSYDPPVGQPPTPCEGVDCSGHGQCALAGGTASCTCDVGYLPSGTDCLAEPSACDGIAAKITEWLDWLRGGLPAGLEDQAKPFLTEYTPGNAAWKPGAEAWTVLGQTGLWQNSVEVACLGFLMAVEADPENPVALNNAATCMFLEGYGDDGRKFADCSLQLAPTNASAKAAQAYHEHEFRADPQEALKKYEEAAQLDPSNPEWHYQALKIAVDLGDLPTAGKHLAEMPAPSSASPGGYRSTTPADDPQQGGQFCCPCGTPATYATQGECNDNCSADLTCFVGLCDFNGQCQPASSPFAFGLKFCVPPVGLQVCFTADTNGTIGVQLGFSVFNGLLGVGAGFQYNVVNKNVNFVAEAGTNQLPINAGTSWTVNLSNGKVEGAVGLSSSSGGRTLQATLLSK